MWLLPVPPENVGGRTMSLRIALSSGQTLSVDRTPLGVMLDLGDAAIAYPPAGVWLTLQEADALVRILGVALGHRSASKCGLCRSVPCRRRALRLTAR